MLLPNKTKLFLSEWQERLLAFVDKHPEALQRQTFRSLERPGSNGLLQGFLSRNIPIQPWPLLLDREQMEACRGVASGVLRILSCIPSRFFDLDAARIADFYGYDPNVLSHLDRALKLPWRSGGEIMRGDFQHDGTHLRCIEINPAIYSGGLLYYQAMDLVLEIPVLKRFFAEEGLQIQCAATWRNLMRFVIERALGRHLHRDGQLNLAIAIHDPQDLTPALPHIEPAFKEILADLTSGTEGRVFFCDYPQLKRIGDRLEADGQPIHILLQKYKDFMFAPVSVEVEAWLDGVIDLYSGPLSWLYNDKRNLALLWEGLETDRFDREERSLIENHIAWTARVLPGQTRYRGEWVDLEPWMIKNREALVLKPAQSYGGSGIHVGLFTSKEAWEEAVRKAFAEGTYAVQEYISSDLQAFQWGESGSQLCEVIWGLFAFGDRYGGSYLRLHPPVEDGIINISKGADGSSLLEVGNLLADDPRGEQASVWSFRPFS